MAADRKALKAIFDEIDTDGGGSLDRAEVAQLAVKMGAPMSEHDLDSAMAEMDADGSGDVDFEEMVTWFTERKTASPLADLLAKKLPTNETGLERELLKVVKGVRDNALAAANFVPLDDVALQLPHRRRRAIVPASSFGHARVLQPTSHAFRSQAQVGKTWSDSIPTEMKGRVQVHAQSHRIEFPRALVRGRLRSQARDHPAIVQEGAHRLRLLHLRSRDLAALQARTRRTSAI